MIWMVCGGIIIPDLVVGSTFDYMFLGELVSCILVYILDDSSGNG